MKIFLLSICLVIISGCATTKTSHLHSLTKYGSSIVTDSTARNVELKTELGNSVYSYSKIEAKGIPVYTNEAILTYPEPYFKSIDKYSFNKEKIVTIKKDSLNEFAIYSNDMNVNEIWVLCRSNFDKKNSERCYYIIENDRITRLQHELSGEIYTLPTPVSVRSYTYRGEDSAPIFSYELLYNGIQNNSIVLTYREYAKNRIRGDFSQNAYYNLSEIKDNVIKYKDITIKILEYNNQFIRYMIL